MYVTVTQYFLILLQEEIGHLLLNLKFSHVIVINFSGDKRSPQSLSPGCYYACVAFTTSTGLPLGTNRLSDNVHLKVWSF